MIILGIETSCDDTGVAIVEVSGKRPIFKILSNVVSSQIKVHQKYGGVVPNLAAREHLKNIEPCLQEALKTINYKPEQIDLIAVTIGPGLIPSLLIGVHFAKSLAYRFNKPIVGVNHLEGHIIAALAAINPKSQILNPKLFPAIALVVSGGHTQLVLVTPQKSPAANRGASYKIIGETRDDAAGECFDKTAKLLGLGYPGGPAIAVEAAKNNKQRTMNSINLPRPMIDQKNYDFSFSGLKTAVLYTIKNNEQRTANSKFVREVCAEAQQAIIDVLINKTLRAAKEYKAKTIVLAGGVAANKELRKQLAMNIEQRTMNSKFLIPDLKLCTDNAAMIAMTGYFKTCLPTGRYKSSKPNTSWKNIKANANLRLV